MERCPCCPAASTDGFDVTSPAAGKAPSSILSMLHGRASLRPSDVAFTFTDYALNPAGDAQSLTWSQLSRRTLNAAREFALHAEVGDRALILAPQGLDYITGFFGAIKAGMVAVPLFAPELAGQAERLDTAMRDARPSVVLTTRPALELIEGFLDRLTGVLGEAATVTVEPDGALTVAAAGSVASVRVVGIADGLDIVSLNQPLAWDLPCNAKTREQVLRHAAATMLGTVTLVERTEEVAANGDSSGGARRKAPASKVADVMLRYNFPGNGLSDEALRTLILMVLAGGDDARDALRS